MCDALALVLEYGILGLGILIYMITIQRIKKEKISNDFIRSIHACIFEN